MGNINGSVPAEGLTSSDGSAYQLKNKYTRDQSSHQLTLTNVGGTASGDIPVLFIARGSEVAEVLYEADESTPRVIDAANPETIAFDGKIEAVVLDLSGLTGTVDAQLESW